MGPLDLIIREFLCLGWYRVVVFWVFKRSSEEGKLMSTMLKLCRNELEGWRSDEGCCSSLGWKWSSFCVFNLVVVVEVHCADMQQLLQSESWYLGVVGGCLLSIIRLLLQY